MSDDIKEKQHRQLLGRSEYIAALDEVFSRASRVIRIFDYNLENGGYDRPERFELLDRFLAADRNNRLLIVVHDPDGVVRNCPRLMILLRRYSYAMSINETLHQAKGVYDPFAIVDERHFVRRFHYDQPKAMTALDDPQGARTLILRFEEIWEASRPAIFATHLGL